MPRGGKRTGAGRPIGQGAYGEPTERIRVPASMVDEIRRYASSRGYRLPMHSNRVQAGVPTAAEAEVEDMVDLNSYLAPRPEQMSLVTVAGESMRDAGINDGDIVVLDSSLSPKPGDIVVAVIDGETTVKYLTMKQGRAYLTPANPDFKEIAVSPESNAVIQGVVTSSFRRYRAG